MKESATYEQYYKNHQIEDHAIQLKGLIPESIATNILAQSKKMTDRELFLKELINKFDAIQQNIGYLAFILDQVTSDSDVILYLLKLDSTRLQTFLSYDFEGKEKVMSEINYNFGLENYVYNIIDRVIANQYGEFGSKFNGLQSILGYNAKEITNTDDLKISATYYSNCWDKYRRSCRDEYIERISIINIFNELGLIGGSLKFTFGINTVIVEGFYPNFQNLSDEFVKKAIMELKTQGFLFNKNIEIKKHYRGSNSFDDILKTKIEKKECQCF